MTRGPESWTVGQALVALLLAPVYVPLFVLLRPGWSWAILRGLALNAWEWLTTTPEPTTTR